MAAAPAVMRVAAAVMMLAGCTESDEERFDRLRAEADTECWSHWCSGGPGGILYPLRVPTEQGVACMNDALRSGSRAIAWWGADNGATGYDGRGTYYLTVDHEVKVFTKQNGGPYEDPVIAEAPSCTGPFQVGPGFCSDIENGLTITLERIDVLGCP